MRILRVEDDVTLGDGLAPSAIESMPAPVLMLTTCDALRSRMTDVDANSAHRRCAICGSEFSCGADRGACWCAELPPLPAERRVAGASCLCPACLSQRLGLVARSDVDRGQ
jgi:hypothetical protein